MPGPTPPPPREKIRIKLAPGKELTIQHMMATPFWSADGTPMSAEQFLEFVLAQYVKVGVDELSSEKLRPLLKLKYHNAIADAVADLGQPEEIGRVFAGFQRYLYEEHVA